MNQIQKVSNLILDGYKKVKESITLIVVLAAIIAFCDILDLILTIYYH